MSQGLSQKIVLFLVAVLVTAAFAVVSISVMASVGSAANEYKCNSGSGNESEPTPTGECDPGNSGGNNQGED